MFNGFLAAGELILLEAHQDSSLGYAPFKLQVFKDHTSIRVSYYGILQRGIYMSSSWLQDLFEQVS